MFLNSCSVTLSLAWLTLARICCRMSIRVSILRDAVEPDACSVISELVYGSLSVSVNQCSAFGNPYFSVP